MGPGGFLDKALAKLGSLLACLTCSVTEGYALGGKSVGCRPLVRTQQRLSAEAIPAEAGPRGCHTCITEPTLPLPALAQRAARPRRARSTEGGRLLGPLISRISC